MTELTGVAISTTGDEHRLPLLEQCVKGWASALHLGDEVAITVDGDENAVDRVVDAVGEWCEPIFRVGQPIVATQLREGRQGVAVSKNTGIEELMQYPDVEHLFLSDDDTWPLSDYPLEQHKTLVPLHSMVMWGKHRFDSLPGPHAVWNWPRGAMLYAHRTVVDRVGGMDERFGPGGHEHVEWSRRIHQAGLTPTPFISPAQHTERNCMGAMQHWHAEDAPRPGEAIPNLRRRKAALTSVRRTDEDWPHIEKIMAQRDGDTSFVPYRASEWGRLSATLYPN